MVIVLPHPSQKQASPHRHLFCHITVIEMPLFREPVAALQQQERGCRVKTRTLFAGVIAIAAIAAPLTAHAQGAPGGFVHGMHEGYRIAGPVGAVVGAPVGGVIGAVEGVFGVGPRYYQPTPVYHRRTVRKHRHTR